MLKHALPKRLSISLQLLKDQFKRLNWVLEWDVNFSVIDFIDLLALIIKQIKLRIRYLKTASKKHN